MLTIDNHKAAQLHFNHVLKSTGDILPIIIRPIDPERDLEAKKAIFSYDRPLLITNNALGAQAAFELKYSHRDHYDDNDLRYAWAITSLDNTVGFIDYKLVSLKNIEYDNWLSDIRKPNYNVLCRSIYLHPEKQHQGLGGAACAVANDFLFTKTRSNFSK